MKRPPPTSIAHTTPGFERSLYGLMAAVALAVVLIGFSRTFYLRNWFPNTPLSVLLYLHGSLMTAWYVLFAAQVTLIIRRRPDVHRRLGIMSAVVGFAIVPAGVATALAFVRMHSNPDEAAYAALVAGYDFVLLAVFWFLLCAALFLRRRSDFHKRLMLLASLSLLAPPLARVVSDDWALWLTYLLVLTPVAVDTWRHRRLHPAFGWGAALIVFSSRIALHWAASARWLDFSLKTLGKF